MKITYLAINLTILTLVIVILVIVGKEKEPYEQHYSPVPDHLAAQPSILNTFPHLGIGKVHTFPAYPSEPCCNHVCLADTAQRALAIRRADSAYVEAIKAVVKAEYDRDQIFKKALKKIEEQQKNLMARIY